MRSSLAPQEASDNTPLLDNSSATESNLAAHISGHSSRSTSLPTSAEHSPHAGSSTGYGTMADTGHNLVQPEHAVAPAATRHLDDKKDSTAVATTTDPELLGEPATLEGPTTSWWEEAAYYLYYNGDNGVGPINYAAILFQSLATAGGHDPTTGGPCTDDGPCNVKFGTERSVPSLVLVANGISLAIMAVLFTTIGSAADYGNLSKYVLMIATVVCWATQFGFLGVWKPQQWHAAMGLYMVGFITYGVTLVFYASIFPRLARNTARTKEARRQLDNGDIGVAEYEQVEMLERNRLSNISTVHSNWGYLITLALNLSILLPLANNEKVNNYTLAFTNCYWIVLGLPWFFLQKPRPGPPLPKGEHWLTIGWKQIWQACKQYRRLPFTFIYLFSFFLLADGFNTTGSVISIVQNQQVQFSFLTSTYLGIVQAATSITSTYSYWYIQRYFKIRTKRMFQVTNIITVLIPLWGMIGLWTNKFGFHNRWEFWAYNALFGLGQAPFYAYSQTMMADLTPPGYEGMFFGLFGLTNRAGALIGPNVCAAIIDRTGNTWHAFIFLFILCLLAAMVIWVWVDMETGRAQAVAFSIEQRGMMGELRAEQVADVIGSQALGGKASTVVRDENE